MISRQIRPLPVALGDVQGRVFVNPPPSLKFFCIVGGLLLLALGVFVQKIVFAEKIMVRGYLNLSQGLMGIYALKSGTIIRTKVHAGDHVHKGDVLFIQDVHSNYKPRLLTILHHQLQSIQHVIDRKKNEISFLRPLIKKGYVTQAVYLEKLTQLSEVMRQKDSLLIQQIQLSEEHDLIRAPMDGVVTNLLAKKGQFISANKLLTHIMPKNAHFIAELLVPVPQSGFLKLHDEVLVHYDAYPFEYYGVDKAEIISIGQSVLTDQAEDKPIKISQPYYRVIAQLSLLSSQNQRKKVHLKQGMTLQAIIVGTKKTLWQWMTMPLYRHVGEYFL
jgi:membrane fusion protein